MPDLKTWAEWILVAIGLGGIFIRVGKVVDKQDVQGEAIKRNSEELELFREDVKTDCAKCQRSCQETTWFKLKLELSERDREFDRKFSTICQGISDIKAEVKRC
jgi:hypothetical protein